jgi:hypothetical protein
METVNFMAKRFKTVGYTFVVKLYHCAVNHPSGLRLNKKANYLANQVIVIVPPGFDGLADTDSFSVKTLQVN